MTNEVGSMVRCRRCGCLKPWNRYTFTTVHGVILQPRRECTNRSVKASRLEHAAKTRRKGKRQVAPQQPHGYPIMLCSDGVWRRILKTGEEE